MATLNSGAVNAKFAELGSMMDLDESLKKKAEKALEGFRKSNQQVENSDNNVLLYLSLSLMVKPGQRVTWPMMQRYMRREIKQHTAIGQKFHMQWKVSLPEAEIPSSLLPRRINPRSIPDFPRNINPDTVWLFPENIDPVLKASLGDLMYVRSETMSARRLDDADTGDEDDTAQPAIARGGPSIATGLPASVPASTTAPPTVPEPSSAEDTLPPVQTKPPPPLKMLKKEDTPIDEDMIAEEIAVETKKAFEAGRILAIDKGNPDSVEFWVMGFLSHVKLLRKKQGDTEDVQSFIESLSPSIKMYLRFVVTRLFNSDAWPLKSLVEVISSICTEFPGLMPKSAKVLMDLANFTLGQDVDKLESVLSLDIASRAYIFRSVLYGAFLEWKYDTEFESVKNPCIGGSMKFTDVDRVLATKLVAVMKDGEKKKELQFVLAFTAMKMKSAVLYMLEADTQWRYNTLRQWDFHHPLVRVVQNFFMSDAPWKATSSCFIWDAALILADDEILEKIPNKSIQDLLKDSLVLKRIYSDEAFEKSVPSQSPQDYICKKLWSEMCRIRVGSLMVTLPEPHSKFEDSHFDIIPTDLIDLAHRYSLKAAKIQNCSASEFDIVNRLGARKIADKPTPSPATPGPAQKKETAIKKVAAAAGKVDVAASSAEESFFDEANFDVGDMVRTKAVKQKANFDNQTATIMTLLKRKVRVRIETGPAAGQMRDFAHKDLKPARPPCKKAKPAKPARVDGHDVSDDDDDDDNAALASSLAKRRKLSLKPTDNGDGTPAAPTPACEADDTPAAPAAPTPTVKPEETSKVEDDVNMKKLDSSAQRLFGGDLLA